MFNDFFIPIITPFKEDESIDYDALYNIAQRHIKEGAKGIYAGGSSAEFPLLSGDERKKTLETIISAVKPLNAKVIAHVGSPSVKESCELSFHASKCGADGISSVAPYYFGYSFEEIKAYYYTLADNSELDVMIYNVPTFTGTAMNSEQLCELTQHSKIKSIKYTDNDAYTLERVKKLSNVIVYSGKDECFLSMLAAGADGAIGTTFNFMLDRFKAIKQCYLQGDVQLALQTQNDVNDIISAIVSSKVIPAVKYLMSLKGYPITEYCRKPIRSLTNKEKELLEVVETNTRKTLDIVEKCI